MKKIYFAIGPWCWGKGETISSAKKKCRVNKPPDNYYEGKFKMRIFLTSPDAYVDEFDGSLRHDAPVPDNWYQEIME